MIDAQNDPVSALVGKLSKYPQVRHRLVDDGCEIDPPNEGGFKVTLYGNNDRWVVGFGEGGFHEEFADPEAALDFIAFGLSNRCRLREVTAPLLRRAVVERRDGADWTAIYEVGFLWWPIPIGRRELIFQNKLIED
jgi:hypothetical protein